MNWYDLPVATSVLTLETLQRGYDAVRDMDTGPETIMYLDPVTLDKYRKWLAKNNWKRIHREFRMFRVACERGWLNASY